MTTWYLGLSTSGHDPALAVVDATGDVVFAEATERYVQDKRAWGIRPDHVAHLERALRFCGADSEKDRFVVSTSWSAAKASTEIKVHDAMLPALDTLWMRQMQAELHASAGASLLRLGVSPERTDLRRHDHHLCHAMTAAWFAPTNDGLILVLDGEGEVGAVSAFTLRPDRIKRLWRSWGPGSLGTFYAWLTFHCGFDWRLGEEWKVMGLAAFGQPIPELQAELAALLHVEGGRLRFVEDAQIQRISAIAARHGRARTDPIEQAADLAATGQHAFAQYADSILASFDDVPEGALILTGGCALNSSYNGTIAGRLGVTETYVPPCPADDGNAIGAALLGWMQETQNTVLPPKRNRTACLGISAKLDPRQREHLSAEFDVESVSGRSADAVAQAVSEGAIIGTFRARAEFGPRALGNRSILADPRSPGMKDRINARVKGRETYRPFAPILRENDVSDWFERPQSSPYMSKTLPWRTEPSHRVPAVVHHDNTGRLQTANSDLYPWLTSVLDGLEARTGVPVLLNTSFNVMGKPIVDSVEDAMAVLCTTGLDAVLIDETMIRKRDGS